MAKAGEDIPQRRGRPKVDRTALVSNVLVKWLELGDPGWSGLYQSARSIVPRETVGYESKREAIYDALRDLGGKRRLMWAIDLAQARGVAVPAWAKDELGKLEEVDREWEEVLATEVEHQKRRRQGLTAVLMRPMLEREDRVRRQGDHIRRWVAFYQAFSDVFGPDTRASMISAAFNEARRAVLRSVTSTVDGSKVAEK
jgi:GNAT superfamily N-acetyltransferase